MKPGKVGMSPRTIGAALLALASTPAACSTSTAPETPPGGTVDVSLDAPPPATGARSGAPDEPRHAPDTPSAAPTETSAPPTAQWSCASDADCTETCALGAVSRAWLAEHPNADTCDDGCGWVAGHVACRHRECVTLRADGSVDPHCSKQPYVPPTH